MKRVDGFLSRIVQEIWPDAAVEENLDTHEFIVDRGPNVEPIMLGWEFRHAKHALYAIVNAERERMFKEEDLP